MAANFLSDRQVFRDFFFNCREHSNCSCEGLVLGIRVREGEQSGGLPGGILQKREELLSLLFKKLIWALQACMNITLFHNIFFQTYSLFLPFVSPLFHLWVTTQIKYFPNRFASTVNWKQLLTATRSDVEKDSGTVSHFLLRNPVWPICDACSYLPTFSRFLISEVSFLLLPSSFRIWTMSMQS